MKKRVLISIMCGILLLGTASWASAAELHFGGDATFEGIAHNNYSFNDARHVYEDFKWWDQRVRLRFDAILENGIEVRTRLDVSDANWDGAAETSLGDRGSYCRPDGSLGVGITPDYAYIHVPIGKMFTADAGHMLDSWGNALISWEVEVDRLVLSYQPNEAMTYALYIQKDEELLQGDGTGDADNYSMSFEHEMSEGNKYGVTASYSHDQLDNHSDTAPQDGWVFDMYWNANMDKISILSEAAMKTGSMFSKNGKWADQFGGFVTGSLDMEPLTLSLTGAFAANYFEANDFFQPTELFGNQGCLALMNFRSLGKDSTSTLIALGADMQVTGAFMVGGKLAYTSIGQNNNEEIVAGLENAHDNFSITELDAMLSYEISKGVSYSIHTVYGIPDGLTKRDESLFGIAHAIDVEF